MIPRYSTPEMSALWSEDNKYQTWLDVEIAVCEVLSDLGEIPARALVTIKEKAAFSIERIHALDAELHHDVIAFLTNLSENIGSESRFVHKGMTSSDLIDTAFALQWKQALSLLKSRLDQLLYSLKELAQRESLTPCIGRSHGIHAEPTTFGFKVAQHYAAFQRHLNRLALAQEEISTCMISGPVGTYSNISPQVQARVSKKLNLTSEPISTQIIARDRHAFVFSVLAGIASSIENLATEIRHLQRTEVREVSEAFAAKQKGSSAMPHKKNPVLSENLTGLARYIRSLVIPAYENITLWHERDISHSSVERIAAPDACIALDFALLRLNQVVSNLVIHPDKMQKNLDALQGLVFSQAVLLLLVEKGLSREQAYATVQKAALTSWSEEKDFLSLLQSDKVISDLCSLQELRDCFDVKPYLEHIPTVLDQLFAN